MSEQRISSFEEFWPYYLGEHRDATCRALHFLGTTAFFATFGLSIHASLQSATPWFLYALGGMFVFGWVGFALVEKARAAFLPMLLIIALGIAAPPHWYIFAGMIFAYAMAWIGHFKVEHNRPATFTYPLWSLLGDFRMWGVMATGRLWRGDSLEWLASRRPATNP